MKTPIYDFVREYAEQGSIRFHMPGHKGRGPLGIEALDITEIDGADVLSSASGIIAESERNAALLFGTGATLYTTEGSSTAIKAMLTVALRRHGTKEKATLLAARSAHRAFLHAAALLDLPVSWIYPRDASTVYSGMPTPREVEDAITSARGTLFAVYLTSPNYLGEMADIPGISDICRRYNLPLLVDNAHGAYLAFLSPSSHPIHLGASMCADSAHKTLPVLTGGAYFHIAKDYGASVKEARDALALFSSTSPSYLQMISLDLCNHTIENGFSHALEETVKLVGATKKRLTDMGFTVLPSEPLRIVLCDGHAEKLCQAVRSAGIEYEFADKTHLVFMISTHNTKCELDTLIQALTPYKKRKTPLSPERAPLPRRGEAVLSIREALFSKAEDVPVSLAAGRICADVSLSCPPAVPPAICGERIETETVNALTYYGFETIKVVKEN